MKYYTSMWEPFKGNARSRNGPAPHIKFTYSTYSQEGAISPNSFAYL